MTLDHVIADPVTAPVTTAPMTLDRLADVTYAAAAFAGAASPGGQGLCLPVTAAVAHTLAAADVPDVHAVCGSYDEHAHWWVRVGDHILDATRHQFDAGPLVCPVDEAPYLAECEYPPGWTREHVVMETQRAFFFADVAAGFAEELLRHLAITVGRHHQ